MSAVEKDDTKKPFEPSLLPTYRQEPQMWL
jgi:hypothetical protein